MKRMILFGIFMIAFLCGCEKKEKIERESMESSKKEVVEPLPEYQDQNETPISFYQLKGNRLERIHSITNYFNVLDDLGLFQIYPSNEEIIDLNTNFGTSFYNTWQTYYAMNPVKIGFSLNISRQDEEPILYNIFNPNQTMDHWEYIMTYLYDDYVNRGKSFYSHIEANEYTDTTLFTAIKLQCGSLCQNISSPLLFTVFTYDGEDDFLNGSYRGNSKYTIPICLHGTC